MALRRFYIPADFLHDNEVHIVGDLFHHIRDVCRFAVGDQFEVLPGDGFALLVEITVSGKREIAAKVLGKRALPEMPKPFITLALSLPKLPKVDWIAEKCVELGVFQLRPFVSDHSFLRRVTEISANRLERWRKLVQAATQQTGRGTVMQIGPPVILEDLLNEFNRATNTGGLFPYEGEAQLALGSTLRSLKRKKLDHIWVFVGSEGGFSRAEVELFARSGLNSVSMGPQILRVETACLAIVSIIKYEFDAL